MESNIPDLDDDPPLDMFSHPFCTLHYEAVLAHAFIFPALCLVICIVALTIAHYRRSRWPDDEPEQEGMSWKCS